MRRGLTRTAAAAMAALLASPALAQPPPGSYGRHMMGDGGGWFMLFGPLMMLLFIGLIVVLVVLALRWLQSSGHGLGPTPPAARGEAPLDLLTRRLPQGEIDGEEYAARRRALGDG